MSFKSFEILKILKFLEIEKIFEISKPVVNYHVPFPKFAIYLKWYVGIYDTRLFSFALYPLTWCGFATSKILLTARYEVSLQFITHYR